MATFLAESVLERSGAWYQHEDFPGGKLNGGAAVTTYLRNNPALFEQLRREAVMKVYNSSDDAKQLEAKVLAAAV